jgi:Domain of unknown function (DUF5060)/Protein of unknown function (DUF4038)/Domain of unknown function (DUF5605)
MNRRELIKLGTGALAAGVSFSAGARTPELAAGESVEQWGVFEAEYSGPSSGNPYTDVKFAARFTLGHRSIDVNGFHDGDGVFRVRFSPDSVGSWSFSTTSNAPALAGHTGAFECVATGPGNRGPVSPAHQFHFQYADGTPYFPFGTTCYAYGFIGAPLAALTLKNLKGAGFNKVRMCLLPKPLGKLNPVAMPFEGKGSDQGQAGDGASLEPFDLARFNPAYFRHVEQRIEELLAADIQADVILFHPYDAWGFKSMGQEADDRYLRYALARLSAYRNVWWSIANEYDLVNSKSMKDWDRFFRIVVESDPYSRLRSIHHSRVVYDHSKPWCTHASLQEYDFEKSAERLAAWNKPIIYDEIQYEGNIGRRWGNLSAEEMTHRFWRAIVNGVYATHGETFMSSDGSPVWSDAGQLHGSSAPRITFLRKLLDSSGTTGLMAAADPYYPNAGNPGTLVLYYFDYHSVGEYEFPLPTNAQFRATLIDPWAMTMQPIPDLFSGKSKIALPGKPYQAVLFERA